MTSSETDGIQVTGFCSQGGRKYMEDMFTVAYQQKKNDDSTLDYAFFGIFDGHGGKEAAQFAKQELMKNIVINPLFWSTNDEDILQAIRLGFIQTHYNMWLNIDEWPKTPTGLPSTSGTTASVAFLRHSKLYIGHVGDSAIVLGKHESGNKTWVGKQLTVDHKPDSEEENERISQDGGQVIVKGGVSRVVWQRPRGNVSKGPQTRSLVNVYDVIPFLAVARSLGDLWSYNPTTDKFVVSPDPDVFVYELDFSRDRCLIFGTDGLFNMLSPQRAAEIVEVTMNYNVDKKCLKSGWQNPSQNLVNQALANWSHSKLRADNTSALVVYLKGPKFTVERLVHIENHVMNDNEADKGSSLIMEGTAERWWYDLPRSVDPANVPRIPIPKTLREMMISFSNPSTSANCIKMELVNTEEPTSMPNHLRERRRDMRRLRRRRMYEVMPRSRRARRQSATLLVSNPPGPTDPVRTRRTRSEEPARGESDCENLGGTPTRQLRSTAPVKTLRSRNVNLDTVGAVRDDHARGKRHKK